MSAYLRSLVAQLGLTDVAVIHGKSTGWAVAAMPVQILLDEDQVIGPDPIIDPEVTHPCDLAHVTVRGNKKSKARQDRFNLPLWQGSCELAVVR